MLGIDGLCCTRLEPWQRLVSTNADRACIPCWITRPVPPHLISAAADSTLRIWDPDTGELRCLLRPTVGLCHVFSMCLKYSVALTGPTWTRSDKFYLKADVVLQRVTMIMRLCGIFGTLGRMKRTIGTANRREVSMTMRQVKKTSGHDGLGYAKGSRSSGVIDNGDRCRGPSVTE